MKFMPYFYGCCKRILNLAQQDVYCGLFVVCWEGTNMINPKHEYRNPKQILIFKFLVTENLTEGLLFSQSNINNHHIGIEDKT